MKPYYESSDVQIWHGNCLDVLPELSSDSVDLICTDPPYFKVKGDAWDNQWNTPADFLAWLDRVLAEFARVLKPNGSLYLFASPQMSARVECLIATRFEVLNNITWRKPPFSTKAEMCEKEAMRAYFPASERIIFAEHIGADSAAKGESGYDAKCDELRGFVFEPLRAYFDEERKRSGLTSQQIQDGMHELTGVRYTFDRHTFSRSQWEMPTKEQYEAARVLFNRQPGEYLCKYYEELRKYYEELRKYYEELCKYYEELRRPFTVSAKVPYMDVWDFETVRAHPGKHVCEKPLPLLRHIIGASSKPGAVVLDAFGGSCSTADAARTLGRRSIIIELDQGWCRRGAARLSQGVLPLSISLDSDLP